MIWELAGIFILGLGITWCIFYYFLLHFLGLEKKEMIP